MHASSEWCSLFAFTWASKPRGMRILYIYKICLMSSVRIWHLSTVVLQLQGIAWGCQFSCKQPAATRTVLLPTT